MSDESIERAVRVYAPNEFGRLDIVVASACGNTQVWSNIEGADGSRVTWDVPYEFMSEIARISFSEYVPNRGRWLSTRIEIDGPRSIIERNWDKRIYFGDHQGAPYEPPAGGDIDPTDDMWRTEFAKWNRSPENIPDWLPPRTEPVVVMDYERPLTGVAAQFANDPATAVWIPRVQALVQDGAEGWIGMREGLREESGELNAIKVSGIAEVTFDRLEEQIWDAQGAEEEAGRRVLDNIYDIVPSILEAQYIGH